ncbi:MAG: RNA polymerase sigma factor [Bacillota bacterium]|nr:RNA polymerase sigma factor [Bacillota bacterium]
MEKHELKILLETMYKLYEQGMYRVAYGVLHNKEQAEDAVQDSFEKLLKYLPQIDAPDSPKTQKLVLKTVRNTAIDQYRRNNKQNEWMAEQEQGEEETNTFVKSVEDREFIQQLLNAVPAEYREIIKLRCYYGFSAKETGDILGLSEGNVNKRLERARKLIADRLEWEEEFDNETGKIRSDNEKTGTRNRRQTIWAKRTNP